MALAVERAQHWPSVGLLLDRHVRHAVGECSRGQASKVMDRLRPFAPFLSSSSPCSAPNDLGSE